MNMKIVSAFIIFFVVSVMLSLVITDSDKEEMYKYRPMVEESYKDGVFTQEEKLVDDGFRYKITVNKNKVVLKYTMMAEKGKQFTSYESEASKVGDSFVWKCTTGLIIKTDC